MALSPCWSYYSSSISHGLTVEDVMEELYFRLQVDEGLAELDDGDGIPPEDVEKRMAKWLS